MMARDGALQRGEQDAAFVEHLKALFAGHPPDVRARTVEFRDLMWSRRALIFSSCATL